jgi:hypothetical protein
MERYGPIEPTVLLALDTGLADAYCRFVTEQYNDRVARGGSIPPTCLVDVHGVGLKFLNLKFLGRVKTWAHFKQVS